MHCLFDVGFECKHRNRLIGLDDFGLKFEHDARQALQRRLCTGALCSYTEKYLTTASG
jgi:hypothetical protein